VGTAPLNLLSKPVELGADNENATEVLIAALDATGSRLIWNLFFAPDLRIYVLNLKTVPDRNVSEPVIPAPPISADGSSPLGKSNRR
jgi:hypothetical protein